jgi:hypothetical protein
MISSLINTKRLGRYHNIPSNNSDNDNSRSQSLFSELESLHKDNSRMASIDFNKPLFGNKYTSLQKLLENANKTTEKATKFLNKIKSKQLAYVNRSKSIPKNATIRKEYIKCGKEMCKLKHGPYYYAYWKDHETKKLKKKYIGDHMPDKKESNNDSNNDNPMF